MGKKGKDAAPETVEAGVLGNQKAGSDGRFLVI
jgi:hypothetical protein